MTRYFTLRAPPERADDGWWDAGPLLPAIVVPDHHAIKTGLVGHRGDAIMRAPLPIGFGRMEEWG